MTNHTYFNLGGHVRVTIEDILYSFHRVGQWNRSWSPIHRSGRSILGIKRRTDSHGSVNNPWRTVVRSSPFFSLGEVATVENTPFDFRTSTAIGARINDSFDGYDMMFVVKGTGKRDFGKWVSFATGQLAIHTFSLPIRRLVDTKSGRAITTESTQKGLQFYTGNFLNGIQGREGAVYNKHGALCLETQNYSDSLNNQVRTTSKWFVSFVSLCFLFYSLCFQAFFFVLVLTIRNKPSSIFTWNNRPFEGLTRRTVILLWFRACLFSSMIYGERNINTINTRSLARQGCCFRLIHAKNSHVTRKFWPM